MLLSRSGRVPAKYLAVFGFTILYMAALASVALGPMDITMAQSLTALLPGQWLTDPLPLHIANVIHQIRLPRTLLAIAVGAILALCGDVMQSLFRNPLADPGIIGVSSGASLGAAMAIVALNALPEMFHGIPGSTLGFLVTPLMAFVGGVLSTVAVYRLGTGSNGTSVTMMLLAGVAIGALSGAATGLLNYIADDQTLRDLSLWTMGSLAGASWSGLFLAFLTLIVLFISFTRDADKLNALLLGEAEARHLGIRVQSLKRRLIILTAVGVGVTVSLSGIIGFVGLVVPHIVRMMSGPDHRALIPLSCLVGALLMLLSDMAARTVAAPMEIPVGIITSAIGAPFFFWLLIQQKGKLS